MTRILLTIIGILVITNMVFIRYARNLKQEVHRFENISTKLRKDCDSVLTLPPDTIELPPIVVHDTTIIEVSYEYDKPDSTAKVFTESVRNDSIDVSVTVLAPKVFSIKFKYSPIYIEKTKEIYIPKPYPIIQYKDREVCRNSLYLTAGLGFSNVFAGKLGLLLTTKKNDLYGLDYIRVGDKNIYMATYGIKF